jgi:hypothetical protein
MSSLIVAKIFFATGASSEGLMVIVAVAAFEGFPFAFTM